MQIPINESSLQMLYGSDFYLMPGELLDSMADSSANEANEAAAPVQQKPEAAASSEQAKVEEPALAPSQPGITWRTKPSSKVLFVIRAEEWADKGLLELLKKIVASIGLPFEMAGFGIISGPVAESEFDEMPNPFAVVFDNSLLKSTENPQNLNEKEIFFSHLLGQLEGDKALKMELWNYLKVLKEKIS